MATYDSIHTGTQVDNAVEIVQGNVNKGSVTTPVYLNAQNEAVEIEKDSSPIAGGTKLVQSGGVYTALLDKYNKSDISTDENLGDYDSIISSQKAVKSYIDYKVLTKQDILTAGEGITISGDTIKVSSENDFVLENKWQHFVDEIVEGSEAGILSKMIEANHSTFDRSKFVQPSGSNLHITEDGIASGFSTTNTINSVCTLDLYESFVVRCEFTTGSDITTGQRIYGWDAYFEFGIKSGGGFFVQYNGYSGQTLGMFAPEPNTTYESEVIRNGTRYYYKMRKKGESEWTLSQVAGAISRNAITPIRIGNSWSNSTPFLGSINLSKFSIISGNTLLFTGSKTGLDIVRKDDFEFRNIGRTIYAFVYDSSHKIYSDSWVNPRTLFNADGTAYRGGPYTVSSAKVYYNNEECTYTAADNKTIYMTISDSGIATGLGTDNWIAPTMTIGELANKSWAVEGAMYWTSNQYNNQGYASLYACQLSGSWPFWGSVGAETSGNWFLRLKTGTSEESSGEGNKVVLNSVSTDPGWYKYRVEYDHSTGTYTLKVGKLNGGYTEEGSWTATTSNTQLYNINMSPNNKMHLGLAGDGFYCSTSVDLNAFKVYIEGELVYQSMIRVPYTHAIDGKKIVDYSHRDRVHSMYEWCGYTPYYALRDDEVTNFMMYGAPTVTTDWVVSDFTTSSYVAPAFINFKGADSFRVELDYIVSSTSVNSGGIYSPNTGMCMNIGETATLGTYSFGFSSNGSSWDIMERTNIHIDVFQGDRLKFVLEYEDNKYSYQIFNVTQGTSIDKYSVTSTAKIYNRQMQLGLLRNQVACKGSIDLKEFKVYVNGQLEYQPILSPRYFISTIKSSEMVDSLTSGTNMYRQYANQVIEQYGECTANTPVVFLKPFIDTNYALSIPYESGTKSTTGFTPSRGGSWKAKGKVSI